MCVWFITSPNLKPGLNQVVNLYVLKSNPTTIFLNIKYFLNDHLNKVVIVLSFLLIKKRNTDQKFTEAFIKIRV